MSPLDIVRGFPTLRDTVPGQRADDPRNRSPIYLIENFFFVHACEAFRKEAEELALQISRISRGRNTRIFSDNSEIVGKLGELIVREFTRSQFEAEIWTSLAEEINPKGGDRCDLLLHNQQIDVKTRQLHTDETIAPNFDLRVPHTEIEKYQDVYILAGYCPTTHYGYVLGWCSWEELQARPVKTDIKFPAKCVPLLDLHPMTSLEKYARMRADQPHAGPTAG